mgnify:CR=1 FL=1|tara:strand:- start:2663 stop:2863 length:201 start_codon:yes stop_codon:yes gene_type:complete
MSSDGRVKPGSTWNGGPEAAGSRRAEAVRTLSSADLFGPAAEVIVDHEGVLYRLRRTSNGKLLLTK